MFLIRTAFWLGVVVLLIPGDPHSGREAPVTSAVNALVAARGAIADLSGMCDRRPEVCNQGGSALQAFGERAGDSLTMIYQTLGSFSASPAPAARNGTLTPADANPVWHAPALRERKV